MRLLLTGRGLPRPHTNQILPQVSKQLLFYSILTQDAGVSSECARTVRARIKGTSRTGRLPALGPATAGGTKKRNPEDHNPQSPHQMCIPLIPITESKGFRSPIPGIPITQSGDSDHLIGAKRRRLFFECQG